VPRCELVLKHQEVKEIQHVITGEVRPQIASAEQVLELQEVKERQFLVAIEVGPASVTPLS